VTFVAATVCQLVTKETLVDGYSREGAGNHGNGHKNRSETHRGGISSGNNEWLNEGCEERGNPPVYMVMKTGGIEFPV
jgi:hypothetical protein